MFCVPRALSKWPERLDKSLGECNESFGFGQENLPQLQNYPPQGRGARDLHGSTPQAAPRLIGKY
jgi:hypothetical protein